MGGFYYSNDKNSLSKAIKSFEKKGLRRYEVITIPQGTLVYFSKLKVDTLKNHIFKCKNDFIIGIGTFFYKGKYSREALELIYEDYKVNGNNIFNNVIGHFNFFINIDQELYYYTDKSGFYHSYMKEVKDKKYISSSLYPFMSIFELEIAEQEYFEYLTTEATYFKPLYKGIEYSEFGSGYLLNNLNNYENYTEIIDQPTDYAEFLKDKMKFIKDHENNIIVDMSGGFDSRLVLSLLKNLNLRDIELFTNENDYDKNDSKIALKIANLESYKINLSKREYNEKDMFQYKNKTLKRFEISRNIYRSSYDFKLLEERFNKKDISIGGWGGEVFRDSGYEVLKDLNRKFYNGNFENQKTKLKSKVLEGLKVSKNEFESLSHGEKHYLIRMKYWAGSRLTKENEVGYRFHPFLDYSIISPAFKEKRSIKYIMELIEKLDSKIAEYNSDKGYNFIWSKNKNYIIKFFNFYSKVKNKLFGQRYLKRFQIFSAEIEDNILKSNKLKEITEKDEVTKQRASTVIEANNLKA